MKKTILAAAVMSAFSAAASAQTTVDVYGIVDMGYVRESGGAAGQVNKLTSGVGNYSRLSFKGSEDLGGGLSAFFTLESGIKADTGEQDAAGVAFNRQSFLGLKTPAATLTLGRQYTSYHTTLVQVADPFATGFAGSSKNLFPDSGNNVRTSNTVMVATPVYSGFSGELSYGFGEQNANAAGRQVGAALGYAEGPLNARIAYLNRNNDVAAAPGVPAVSREVGRNLLLAANYDFGVVKVYAAYGMDKGFGSAPLANPNNPYGGVRPTASVDGNEQLLGVAAPLVGGSLLATFQRKNDKTSFNQDARSYGLGYLYPLSKRTTLYGAFGYIDNKNGAGYTVANNTEAGSGNRAYNLGVRHTF